MAFYFLIHILFLFIPCCSWYWDPVGPYFSMKHFQIIMRIYSWLEFGVPIYGRLRYGKRLLLARETLNMYLWHHPSTTKMFFLVFKVFWICRWGSRYLSLHLDQYCKICWVWEWSMGWNSYSYITITSICSEKAGFSIFELVKCCSFWFRIRCLPNF
jgi:hypothetical protein